MKILFPGSDYLGNDLADVLKSCLCFISDQIINATRATATFDQQRERGSRARNESGERKGENERKAERMKETERSENGINAGSVMSCIRKRVRNERELAGSLNNAGSNVKETEGNR